MDPTTTPATTERKRYRQTEHRQQIEAEARAIVSEYMNSSDPLFETKVLMEADDLDGLMAEGLTLAAAREQLEADAREIEALEAATAQGVA